jgi:Domain of unknown function (DUF4249)
MNNIKYNFKYKFNFLLVATITVVLTGCIRKLDVQLPEGTAQLVVNTHLTNDEILPFNPVTGAFPVFPNVQLSKSADPLDPQSAAITDENALVQISENGNIVATGIYSSTMYSSVTRYNFETFKPQPNKNYTLRIKTAGFDEVLVNATTPSVMPDFKAVHTVDSSSTGQNNGPGGRRNTDRITITFKDDPNTTDFYEVKSYTANLQGNEMGLMDTVLRENQLSSNSPSVETNFFTTSALLTDNSFNGQNFSFYVNDEGYYFDNNPVVARYVRVYKITKERYLYLKSVVKQAQGGNGSNPFAEPSFIYSNMPNGFGIFSFGLGKTVKATSE